MPHPRNFGMYHGALGLVAVDGYVGVRFMGPM